MAKLTPAQLDLLWDVYDDLVTQHDNGESVAALFARSTRGGTGPRKVTSRIRALERKGLIEVVERTASRRWRLTPHGFSAHSELTAG